MFNNGLNRKEPDWVMEIGNNENQTVSGAGLQEKEEVKDCGEYLRLGLEGGGKSKERDQQMLRHLQEAKNNNSMMWTKRMFSVLVMFLTTLPQTQTII